MEKWKFYLIDRVRNFFSRSEKHLIFRKMPLKTDKDGLGIAHQQLTDISQQCCLCSRRSKGRIAALCNSCWNAEEGRQGKQDREVIFGQRLSPFFAIDCNTRSPSATVRQKGGFKCKIRVCPG
jgi:hypothetical protein